MTHKHHRIGSAVAAAAVVGALAVPAAQARTFEEPVPSKTVAPTVTVPASHSSFDWGDAAVGAGGATGLIAIGLGSMLAAQGRRHRRQGPVQARMA